MYAKEKKYFLRNKENVVCYVNLIEIYIIKGKMIQTPGSCVHLYRRLEIMNVQIQIYIIKWLPRNRL